jgi:hypothetical protein
LFIFVSDLYEMLTKVAYDSSIRELLQSAVTFNVAVGCQHRNKRRTNKKYIYVLLVLLLKRIKYDLHRILKNKNAFKISVPEKCAFFFQNALCTHIFAV